MTREKEIERYLVEQVKKRGGKAYKWVSPGNLGVPDRIAMFPGGWTRLIEVKAERGRLSAQQIVRHKELSKLSWPVFVINSKAQVDELIRNIPS